MEWLEANPLPRACVDCREEDCYNCDHAAERWVLSRQEELCIRRKLLLKSIQRLQKQVAVIDEELQRKASL